MRQLLLLSLVVALATAQAPLEQFASQQQQEETSNLDPSLSSVVSHGLRTIQNKLREYQEELDKKFGDLEKTCKESSDTKIDIENLPQEMENKVEKLAATFVDQLLRFSAEAIQNVEKKMVEALDGALEQIDVKLVNVNEQINGLSTNMSVLVTQEEVADLQKKLTEIATESLENITSKLADLPKQEDVIILSNKMEEQLLNISTQIETLNECGNTDTVDKVLQYLQESGQHLEEVSGFLQDSSQSSTCSSSCDSISEQLQSLQDTLQANRNGINNLNGSLLTMQDSLSTRLEGLESTALEITEVIQKRAETTTTTTTTTPVPTTTTPPPCLDSKFMGSGRSLDICNAAVRFRKCHLTFVAYHCCRSCMDAGLITSIPNYKGPREISVLAALESIKPLNMPVVG